MANLTFSKNGVPMGRNKSTAENNSSRWTAQEDNYLKMALEEGLPSVEVAAKLGRSIASLQPLVALVLKQPEQLQLQREFSFSKLKLAFLYLLAMVATKKHAIRCERFSIRLRLVNHLWYPRTWFT